MQTDGWKLLVNQRRQLLDVVAGIQDASRTRYPDNTTPNYRTVNLLKAHLTELVAQASFFGVYVVTRHCECGRPGHREYAVSNPYGLNVSYLDKRYIWEGDQAFQGSRCEICPCSKNNEATDHWVIDDIIYDRKCDLIKGRAIAKIVTHVSSAIKQAAEHHPRSAIRESLLRALVHLNDVILPTSVDDYIAQQLEQSRSRSEGVAGSGSKAL